MGWTIALDRSTISVITSAKTARKQVPAIYKLVKRTFGWEEGSVNFDIGGGP